MHPGLPCKHPIQLNIFPGKNVPDFTINYMISVLKAQIVQYSHLKGEVLKTREIK